MTKTNNTATNWKSIITEAPTTTLNFARGNLSLREFIFSVRDKENRRQLYSLEKNGGTTRARTLVKKALRRHGVRV